MERIVMTILKVYEARECKDLFVWVVKENMLCDSSTVFVEGLVSLRSLPVFFWSSSFQQADSSNILLPTERSW